MKNNYLSFFYESLRSYTRKISILAAFVLLMLLSLAASANNYTVSNTLDGNAANQLRGALVAAGGIAGTHVVTVNAGIYNLGSTISFGSINSVNITINGAGAGVTIIDAGLLNRAFIFNTTGAFTNVTITMNNLTIRNSKLTGDSFGGGAVLSGGTGAGNVSNFNNCTFENNTISASLTTPGGAIRSSGGSLSISGCVFTNNSNPNSSGGAVRFDLQAGESGTLTVTNSTFSANTAPANSAAGGAIDIGIAGSTTFTGIITENTFLNNSAPNGLGGAIGVSNGLAGNTMAINYNSFVGNTASAANSAQSAVNVAGASGNVNLSNNWWGCNSGAAGCADKAATTGSGGTNTYTPHLQLRTTAGLSTLCSNSPNNTATITSGFTSNSANGAIATSNLGALIGRSISFSPSGGSISGAQTTIQSNGNATATFTANGTASPATVSAVVDNVPADDLTAQASFTVKSAPTISGPDQPDAVSVCLGSSTSLSVVAGGTAPFTYQWRKGTTNLSDGVNGNGATISGVTSATLSINNITAADDGSDYNVVITNSCGSATSNNTDIDVSTAPSISAGGQPTSITPCPGSSATFTVTPTGSAPFTYQWYKGTTALNNGATGNGSTISGATTATLTISNVSGVNNATNYNVKVINGCSANGVTSNNVALTTVTLPTPTTPNSESICQGQNVVFNASATGTPPFTYQWRRGTTLLANGPTGNGSTISGATTNQLTISNVSAADAASTYNYVVNNGCTTSAFSFSGTLTVKTAPTVSDQPDAFNGCTGSPATFTVVPAGSGPFTYQWRKGTNNLNNGATANGSTISGATTATLTIDNTVTADVAGNYNVVITNSCSNVTSANAALALNNAPSIGTQPLPFYGCSGYAASFSVSASSNLSLTYRWYKGAAPLANGSTGSGSVISGATSSTLLITNPSPADNAADYHVQVTNSCTSTSSNDVSLSISSSLPTTLTNGSASVATGDNIIYGAGCGLITTIIPSGGAPLSGNTTAKVWVEPSVPSFSNAFYLARHYEITPTNEGSATLKLYYLQSEFDAYNQKTGHGLDLPIDATDLANNKNNIKIVKKSGTSTDGSGKFDTYAGAFTTITPNNVAWDASSGYWIVTFNVADFSGFFLTTNPVALPVSLISFNAKAQGNHTVDITWSTASETNNKSFLVERSKDMKAFEKVGEINDIAALSNAVKNYHLTDSEPFSGTSYYRLAQTDLDGKKTLYRAVSVIVRSEAYGVFPNPVAREGQFTLRLDEPESAVISFHSVDGRAVLLRRMGVQSGHLLLKSDKKLAPGIYLLSVTERGQTRTHRLVME